MSDRNVYMFGVVRGSRDNSYGTSGLGGEENDVYTVTHKDLQAVVCNVPAQTYDPSEANVIEHQRVIEGIMEHTTVVPMSFGTTFKKRGDVVELLKQTHSQIRKVLSQIADRIELGVKVFWDEKEVVQKVVADDPEIAEAGDNYQDRVQTGRRVESALDEYRKRYVEDIHSSLKEYAVASRANKNIGRDMIFNAAFLVEKKEESSFDERMNEIGLRYEGELDFKYTGPWPPYNFVNIKLQVE